MANVKTILMIEVRGSEYHCMYSGKFKPDFSKMTEKERKEVLRHDTRILNTLLACPEAFARIAGFVHSVERAKRKEVRKKANG
jgi:hypothetical protein